MESGGRQMRKRKSGDNETPEERDARLKKDRERQRLRRQNETEDQRNARQEKDRNRHRVNAENRVRLDRVNDSRRSQREQETNEQRIDRLHRERNTANSREIDRNYRQSTKFRTTAQNADNDESCIPENYLGTMSMICTQCLSMNFAGEVTAGNKTEFSRCCQKGQVKLEALKDYPEYFIQLMTGKLPESKKFMECIRSYNSSFAFASTGANIKPPPGNGPYCFRVSGQIAHRTGTLHPDNNEPRKFSQIYILDPNEAAYQRMSLPENKDCNEKLMRNIGQIMDQNPFALSIKHLHEVEKELEDKARAEGIEPTKVTLAILDDRKSDPRRYNGPVVNEVAVVFQSRDGEPPLERDIIMHLKPDPNNPNTKIKRVNILSPNLDPLTYPILFPNGDPGWHVRIPRVAKTKATNSRNDEPEDNDCDNEQGSSNSRTKISMREYFSYRLSARNEFNPLLNAGKLSQQYMVDAYVRAEAKDLNFIRMNQPKLRADKYNNLIDHINNDADSSEKPGTSIILPSSFQGSPRNMQQHYQDAMAIGGDGDEYKCH